MDDVQNYNSFPTLQSFVSIGLQDNSLREAVIEGFLVVILIYYYRHKPINLTLNINFCLQ
jgi:hypothetical protein